MTETDTMQRPVRVASYSALEDRAPAYALVADVDLVVIRYDDAVSVLYGRCLHRGALMSDGHVQGENLICGLHGWDYRLDTGVSAYDNREALHRFSARVDHDHDAVWVDEAEVRAFAAEHPQPYDRKTYLGLYQDPHGAPEEPFNGYIQGLARDGLREWLGITRQPELVRVDRYLDAMPRYHVGHAQRVARIEAQVARLPGLQLVGGAYHGVGMPDVIASAERAVELGGHPRPAESSS